MPIGQRFRQRPRAGAVRPSSVLLGLAAVFLLMAVALQSNVALVISVFYVFFSITADEAAKGRWVDRIRAHYGVPGVPYVNEGGLHLATNG